MYPEFRTTNGSEYKVKMYSNCIQKEIKIWMAHIKIYCKRILSK